MADRARAIRTMVAVLVAATTTSRAVPPIEPTIRLLAIQNPVPHNITSRIGMPRIRNSATVPKQEAVSGNQSLHFVATARPKPMLVNKTAPTTHKDLVHIAKNERTVETAELAVAVGFAKRAKCTTYAMHSPVMNSLNRLSSVCRNEPTPRMKATYPRHWAVENQSVVMLQLSQGKVACHMLGPGLTFPRGGRCLASRSAPLMSNG